VFVVAAGALSNTIVFIALVCCSLISLHYFKHFPEFWFKVICWIGIYATLDSPLTFILDTAS
jgi:hypothetical protein